MKHVFEDKRYQVAKDSKKSSRDQIIIHGEQKLQKNERSNEVGISQKNPIPIENDNNSPHSPADLYFTTQ